MGDNLDTLIGSLPRVWDGVQITLILSVGGALLALVVAVVLGLAGLSRLALVRGVARIIVELFRGTSLVVQLFWLFYVLPLLFGISLDSIPCAILALGLNYGAYGSEVVRGSLASVPKGQWETTVALNMSPMQRMRRIIWPQAWALMLPGLNNLTVMLVKGTSLASFVLLTDLTFVTNQMRRETGTFFAFGVGLLIYYAIAWLFSWFLRRLEVRARRKLGQLPPSGRRPITQPELGAEDQVDAELEMDRRTSHTIARGHGGGAGGGAAGGATGGGVG